MTTEERMKLYKEKFGKASYSSSSVSGKKKGGNYKKNGAARKSSEKTVLKPVKKTERKWRENFGWQETKRFMMI